MSDRIRDERDRLQAAADRLTDADLLAKWDSFGRALRDASPDEFRGRIEFFCSAFADKPQLPATLEVWNSLAAKLIGKPRVRRIIGELALTFEERGLIAGAGRN